MIHSSYYRPRVYPFVGAEPVQIDRLQDLSGSLTLNREKIKEIGRDGTVDWRKRIPTLRLTARQLEYGDIEFYRKLANKGDATTTIALTDFKTSMVDIAGFKTDDSGTFLGTVWYPRLRVSGFGLSIGDPQANIERTFDFTGEDEITLLNNNKYFISRAFVVGAGTNTPITISDGTTYPHPVYDPDNSASYLLKMVRDRAGVGTELDLGTDYTYNNGTHIATIGTTEDGDIIRVYWSATTAGTQTIFTNNDTDASVLPAENASIYLLSANYLYKLQSVNINVSFDRSDLYEIGSTNVIQRGVRNKTITVTLGRILDAYTPEEILRGLGGSSTYGKIDPRLFYDNSSLIVKLYSTSAKSSFLLKYHITDLTPTGLDAGVPLDDYVTRGVSLESEAMTIATVQ